MSILRALGSTIYKMFVGDIGLTATALFVVAACAALRAFHALPAAAVPFLLAVGILLALGISVARGIRR